MKAIILILIGLILGGCAMNSQYPMTEYQRAMMMQAYLNAVNQSNADWNAYYAQQNYNTQQQLNRAHEDFWHIQNGR